MNVRRNAERLLLVIAAVASGGCGDHPASGPGEETGTAGSDAAVLGVREFMRQREVGRGARGVEGIVSCVAEKEGVVGIVDCADFAECGGKDCCDLLTLPVRWTGTLPAPGQRVRVVGSVEERPQGKVFVASQASVVEPEGP